MSKLEEAFDAANKVHVSIDFQSSNAFTYLTLECLGVGGSGEDNASWAATFDYVSEESEWYEFYHIKDYPTAFRATNPADAIMGAVSRFWVLYQKGNRKCQII